MGSDTPALLGLWGKRGRGRKSPIFLGAKEQEAVPSSLTPSRPAQGIGPLSELALGRLPLGAPRGEGTYWTVACKVEGLQFWGRTGCLAEWGRGTSYQMSILYFAAESKKRICLLE